MRKFSQIGKSLFIVFIGFAGSAYSQCVDNLPAENLNVSFPSPITIDNQDISLGKVLATVTLSHSICVPTIEESSEVTIVPSANSQIFSSGQKQMLNVIPTDIEGVGLRWMTRVNGRETIMTAGGVLSNTAQALELPKTGQPVNLTEQFELVRTGIINPAKKSLVINDIVMQRKDATQRSTMKDLYTIRFAPIALYRETCTGITIPTVNLGNIPSGVFKSGKGATSQPVAFNVEYKNCPATADFTLKFDPISVVSAQEGVIGLENKKGGAKNIGIQILNDSRQPVVLGKTREVKMTSQAGIIRLVYYARYIRTSTNPVNAGIADGEVTITTDYK